MACRPTAEACPARLVKRYQDPTLDQLIALGGADSPSLATAHARI